MLKSLKWLLFLIVCFSLNTSILVAAEQGETNSENTNDNAIDKYNQMMMVFVQRLKSGNVAEARKIAKEIADYSKNYKDDANTEYKSFYSNIEKELYILKNKDNKKKVVWVEEPIADGYYFLAVIDFQEGKYKEAIEDIQKCISWNPVRSPYYCERGFIFLNSGKDPDAINAEVAYLQALEYANNEEDFASALRGLSFALAARNEFDVSMAAMVLSKEFERNSVDADEHILRLKKLIPNYDFEMNAKKARQILKENKIQTTYSPEHVRVLIKLASALKKPEEKEKAIIFLTHAQMLEPMNVEVMNKLKDLQKK